MSINVQTKSIAITFPKFYWVPRTCGDCAYLRGAENKLCAEPSKPDYMDLVSPESRACSDFVLRNNEGVIENDPGQN